MFNVILISIVGLFILCLLFIVAGYNTLIRLDQRSRQAYADIDVQMKLRHDLIPNLAATVKGYATHEKNALEDVIKARSRAVSPGQDINQQVQSENFLTAALGRLFALSEAYPELKADANFRQLQDELSDIENKIAASRRFYNNVVAEFNASIDTFPIVLFSRSFGFSEKTFFDVGAERDLLNQAPAVSFQ